MPVALISVSNKDGLLAFARELISLGWKLIASGGTARALKEAGMEALAIDAYTGSPEILGGRVKTLHPAVHGGILARSTPADLEDVERIHGQLIDLVVVNLYPFEETIQKAGANLEAAIESIDIGGVALIRAAAKNFERVAVLVAPEDYAPAVEELRASGMVSLDTRQRLAVKAFQHTARYDAAIAAYLEKQLSGQDTPAWLQGFPSSPLRYGENPHQPARLYHLPGNQGPLGGKVLQGKELSYNNLLDLDAAWRTAVSFQRSGIAIVKHLSPCGIACADELSLAFPLALASDPVSAFGGVIAANRLFDAATAEALGSLFIECIVAPGFSPEALEKLAKRKNCRLVEMPGLGVSPNYEVRSVNGGLLWQMRDQGDPTNLPGWRTVTQREPTEAELDTLHFAWKACQHVKSNAIVFASGEATVGIGGGQPNRVHCVRIAAERAGELARGAVMASDAFFPFPDSVEEAARAGITAIVQPGGSVRDQEAIDAADRHGIAMVLSGVRHFRH